MKQISEKCMMVLVCMMLAGCGSKTELYLEQSGTELSKEESENVGSGSDVDEPEDLKSGDPKFQDTGKEQDNSQTAGNAAKGDTVQGPTTQNRDSSGKSAEASSGGSSGKIAVYVCGEVKNPGVYELTDGTRICDAVEAAGGFTKQAGREYWNLAEPLTDGQMLCVPTEAEAQKRQEEADSLQQTSSGAGNTSKGFGGDTSGETTLVNINTADATLLTSIPGIGQVRAEAVIAYRQEHGSFQRIEDIKKVSGIGDALFAKMKDHITVS